MIVNNVAVTPVYSLSHSHITICASHHRRTGRHPFGGADRVLPEWIQWGGVVAEISRDWGARIFSVNSSNRPSIRVIQTCIVFCPNNVDSLPEFMSTLCPNWGGSCPPCPPVPYAYASHVWRLLIIILTSRPPAKRVTG